MQRAAAVAGAHLLETRLEAVAAAAQQAPEPVKQHRMGRLKAPLAKKTACH
jgi:hypothetical protein